MRVKRGVTSHARHKKILSDNKGYRMTKRRLIKVATEAHLHAGEYAFRGRKQKKRDFRRLWITRISEHLKKEGISYSSFMHLMEQAHIEIDRKMLSYLVTEHPQTFKTIIETVRKSA